MKTKTRSYRRLTLAAGWTLGLGLLATSGCLTRPLEPQDPRTTWTATFRQTSSGVDKIDLLLMLDNSGSMADKQDILGDAVPALVRGLLNPQCVDKDNKPIANQPASPADPCPAGSAYEFEPVLDVHIGIVSSSLGSHGGNGCTVNKADQSTFSQDDHGHLVARGDASMPTVPYPTYQSKGFLAWDPSGKADSPPGDSDINDESMKLRDMVTGVGDVGCGYESQLESWYRFLVDPEPYDTISLDGNNNVVRTGTDQALLDQRAAFLRPDSMVAVLMLTDENDCSTREDRYYPISNDIGNAMPRGRAVCATDPNDRCCAPCGYAPKDCPADNTCDKPNLDANEDPENLRCWNQKKRFGIDFLYPVQRYVDAITQPQIARRDGQLVDNPLFPKDPDHKLNARTPDMGLVFVAGIVGVPWQDIARQNKDGAPDLINGLDKHGNPVGGFMSAEELSARDGNTHKSRWDVILGDPANNVPPDDKLMVESRAERTGTSPIVNSALAPSSAGSPSANPVNGHEWNTDAVKISKNSPVPAGDLQYACIFPLKKTRDCSASGADCDCVNADTNGSNNPLCQDDTGAYTQTQRKAKGYPGVRELEVLRGAGDQGIVASVCPAQLDPNNTTAKDYGYNPAIGAIIDKLKQKLTGQCLNRPLKPDTTNKQVKCIVIEASKSDGGACCTGKARSEVDPAYNEALTSAKSDPFAAGDDCFCQIDQLAGAPLDACESDTSPVPVDSNGSSVDGWCYVDSTVGNSDLVSGCPSGEQQKIRFVGAGQPTGNAYAFVTCSSDN